MGYPVTVFDFFEVFGHVGPGMDISYAGANPPSATTFGPVIEPLEFQNTYPDMIMRGSTLELDGTTWRVSGLAESSGLIFNGDPSQAGAVSSSTSVVVVRLTDGTATRTLMAIYDPYNSPLNAPDGTQLDITHMSLWNYDSLSSLPARYLSVNDPNRMHAICFAAGTMIETASGPRPVQTLRVGEQVLTRDHGLQPLRWLGGRRLSGADLARAPRLAPIRIAAGALGPRQPSQDLTVSPQHRLLVRSRIAERIAGAPEVLVAAVHLLDLPGVERLAAPAGVGYWHLMFDRHEIVFANGAEAESLYLGPMARQALTPEALAEIALILPEITAGPTEMVLARTTLRGNQTRRLVERQVRNAQPLVAPLPLG